MSSEVKLKINPLLIPAGPGGSSDRIIYPEDKVNQMVRSEYMDTLGAYQRAFGMYRWMQLDKHLEYRIERIDRSDVAVQKFTNCAFQDGALMTTTTDNIRPSKSYIKASRCIDEDFNSHWEGIIKYKTDGGIEYDAIGKARENLFIENLLEDYTYALNRMNVVGNYHDKTTALRDKITAEQRVIWDKTTSETKGFHRLQVEYANDKGAKWMNRTDLIDETLFSEDGSLYNGSIKDIISALLRDGKVKKLQKLANGVVQTVRGKQVWTYIKLSNAFYNKVLKELEAENTNALQNQRTWKWETINGAKVITYDQRLPVIPCEYVNGFDEYLKGDTHSITISVSGNIQFGGNWAEVQGGEVYGFRPGIIISRGTDPGLENFLKWTVLSLQLQAGIIVDPDLFTGLVTYVSK